MGCHNYAAIGKGILRSPLQQPSPEFIRHLITTFTLDVKTGIANLCQFTQQPQNNKYSKNYSQRTRNYFLLRLKKHNSISVMTTRELRTQRAYPWTHPDMSQSQDDNILDSITIAGSQPTPQAGSTAIQDVTNETTIDATNLNVEGGNAMKKKVGQTLAGGRPIRNKLGTLDGFKTNRTRIEVTTKPSDVMERKIDRRLTIVEEFSNKCRAQEDQITDLKKYVSDAWDEVITNQEEVYRCNQFWMTATDAAIREIKAPIDTTSQTQAKKPTTVARSKDQGPRVENVNNCITTQDNEERIEVVDCGGLDQSRHAPQLMPGGTVTDDGETTPMKKPVEETSGGTNGKAGCQASYKDRME
jgi:hypothetical protein